MGQQNKGQERIMENKRKNAGHEIVREEFSRVLRSTSVIMCIYFIALMTVFTVFRCSAIVLFGLAGFLIFLYAYSLSYRNKVKTGALYVYLAIILYVVSFIYVFGWQGGAQTFLFVAPVLIFITDFIDKKLKIIYCVIACFLRFFLFYFHSNLHEPVYTLNEAAQFYMEIINIVSVFAFLGCCAIVFSEEVYALERNLVQSNKKLANLASEDAVTGLDNRRSILDYLKNTVSEFEENSDKKVSLSIGDIDFFKKVNDNYGHDCGDEVLRQLADLFQDFMKDKGNVGRWGGEEFLFVFNDANGEKASAYLTELLEKIRKYDFTYYDEHIPLTMTFGMVEYTKEQGVASAIVEADKKLYQGKDAGRNRIVF